MIGIDEEALTGRLVSLTRDLMLIPGTAERPQDIARCVEFVGNHLDTLPDVRIDTYTCGGHPSIVAMPAHVREPEILLCAHLDVVEHGDASHYRAAVSNGRIVGPGAGDMKGQLAILLELFAACRTRHPAFSVGIAITSDEECGGMAGMRYLFEEAGLRCGEAVLPDGGSLNSVVIEEKGVLHLRLHATGRAAHAAYPWQGENPLERLQDALLAVREHFAAFRTTAPGHWYPTCTMTAIETESRAVNRIPGWASALVDIRFTPPLTQAEVIAAVHENVGPGVALEVILGDEPSHLQPNTLFLEAITEVTGEAAGFVQVCGGSDARFLCRKGIPVHVSRPLVGDLHGKTEWIDIASMAVYYQIVERFVLRRLLDTGNPA